MFKPRKVSSVFLVSLTVTMMGCSGATMTALKVAPAKSADCQVEIFASESEVTKKFETLCLVEAHTGQGLIHDRTASGAIALARPKLCDCGADAAILTAASSMSGNFLTATVFTPSDELRGRATLRGIRYLEK